MAEIRQVVGMQLTAQPAFVLVIDANGVAHSQLASGYPVPELLEKLRVYVDLLADDAKMCGDEHEVWLDVEGTQRRLSTCDLPAGHDVSHSGIIDDEGNRALWLGNRDGA